MQSVSLSRKNESVTFILWLIDSITFLKFQQQDSGPQLLSL